MKAILIVFLSLISIQSISQKISLSERENWNSRADDYEIIGKYQDYLAIYYKHAGIGEINFYGKNLIKEKVTTLGFLPQQYEQVFFNTNQQQLMVCYVIKENKMKRLFGAKLLPDNSWSTPILLDSVKSGSYRYNTEYTLLSNANHTKVLAYTSSIENESTLLNVLCINHDLQIINRYKESYTIPDFFITSNACLSNDGNAFIIATDVQNNRGVYEKLTLLSCANNQIQANVLDTKQYALSDLHMKFEDYHKNLIICSYFSPEKYSQPRGIYYSVFDETTQSISNTSFTPLTLQLTNRQAGLRDMKIQDVYISKNHEIEIVAEKTFQTTRTVQSVTPLSSSSFTLNNQQEIARTVEDYSFDEIVLFHFKPDGSLAWNQTILKEQTTSDDKGIYSSFGIMEHALGKGLLFNDVSSNQNRLLGAYVSYKGDVTMKELALPSESDDWNLLPRNSIQISKSEIVLPCVSKSYICFLKITY